MTPEAQRIAIAEALSFTFIGKNFAGEDTWSHPKYEAQGFNLIGDKFGRGRLPDYPHDANAALEFAKQLASEGWRLNCYTTTDHKQWICIFFRMEMDSFSGCADTMPLAICEAGLRVKGLWHD